MRPAIRRPSSSAGNLARPARRRSGSAGSVYMMRFRSDRCLRGRLYFNLPRLGRFLLGKGDAEDAVLEGGGDLLGIKGVRHGEAAHELAVVALDPVIALVAVLGLELPLAGDGERL